MILLASFRHVYAGLHCPSDLIGGALIGVLCTLGAAPPILRAVAGKVSLIIDRKLMPLLWVLIFLYVLQMTTMFHDGCGLWPIHQGGSSAPTRKAGGLDAVAKSEGGSPSSFAFIKQQV